MGKRYLKIFNGNIITPSRLINEGTLIIEEDHIVEVTAGNVEVSNAIEINANGNYISPGFMDIHVHGGGGYDFMDGTVEAFVKIAELHARFGTTSIVPTSLTSDTEGILKVLSSYDRAVEKNDFGAEFIGMHLEGPYFAMGQRGAQDPRYIRNPNPEEYRRIIRESSGVKRWSAAPELKGSLDFGRYLRNQDILPAIAHTEAVYDDILKAYENGYSLVTHLYSGMLGVTRCHAYRYAGLVESAYLMDELDVELIADGVHLPASLLKLAYKIKGADKLALITDAMRAAGMPPGESILGSIQDGIKVIVEDGVAKLPDRKAFAGSVATADRLVRNMISLADVSLLEAVKMMTQTPARIMKVDHRKGSLVKEKDADVVIFDKEIKIEKTIIKGKEVYSR